MLFSSNNSDTWFNLTEPNTNTTIENNNIMDELFTQQDSNSLDEIEELCKCQ